MKPVKTNITYHMVSAHRIVQIMMLYEQRNTIPSNRLCEILQDMIQNTHEHNAHYKHKGIAKVIDNVPCLQN